MKKTGLYLAVIACLVSGCESSEVKEQKKLKHLASLTCDSSKAGRSKEELQAISDACFKRGTFKKSSGRKW